MKLKKITRIFASLLCLSLPFVLDSPFFLGVYYFICVLVAFSSLHSITIWHIWFITLSKETIFQCSVISFLVLKFLCDALFPTVSTVSQSFDQHDNGEKCKTESEREQKNKKKHQWTKWKKQQQWIINCVCMREYAKVHQSKCRLEAFEIYCCVIFFSPFHLSFWFFLFFYSQNNATNWQIFESISTLNIDSNESYCVYRALLRVCVSVCAVPWISSSS